MIKNLIFLLTIAIFLPRVTIQQEWCGGLPYFRCMDMVMSELSGCFETIARSSILADNTDGEFENEDEQFKVNFNIFGGNEHKYVFIIKALEYVGQLIPDIKTKKEVEFNSPRAKARRVFTFANASYAFYSISKGKHIAYHNICHGLQVMFFSGMIYYSATQYNDIDSPYLDGQQMAIMFAGLFHDAAHPGFGNEFYQLLAEDNAELHNTIGANIDKFAQFALGVEGPDVKPIKTMGLAVKALVETNKGELFRLENIHALIAVNLLNIITRSTEAHGATDLVSTSILNTAKGAVESFKLFTGYENLLKSKEADNKKIYEQFELFVTKMVNVKNRSDITAFVHMADVSANATSNKRFMMSTIKGCLYEFVTEIATLKERITSEKVSKEDARTTGAYGAIGGLAFAKIFKGQFGFSKFAAEDGLDYIGRYNFLRDIFEDIPRMAGEADHKLKTTEFSQQIESEKEEFDQLTAAKKRGDVWKIAHGEFLESIEGYSTYNDTIEPCDILDYFRHNIIKNEKWFLSQTINVIDSTTYDLYFMYMSKDTWDASVTIA